MILAILAIGCGLALLVWSADRFVEGAAVTARHFGMSPLLIGMVIVGFGTSAPEMAVSVLAALEGLWLFEDTQGFVLDNARHWNWQQLAGQEVQEELLHGLAYRPTTQA